MAQRALQLSARRFALQQRTTPPLALAVGLTAPSSSTSANKRLQTTVASAKATPASPDESYKILENQRLHRPVSPHLTIYQPQITWIPSILNRITGSVLSGGLYIFGFGYLVAPLLGWSWSSAAMAAGFAKWPLILKGMAKFGLAWPFAFHSWNGVRHLVWDMGKQFKNEQVARTGWAVVGLSVVTALGLAVL